MYQNLAFLVIGAILGGVIGWLTNSYFYRKADKQAILANHPLEERTDQILYMLLQSRLENRWNKRLAETISAEGLPSDKGIPHILQFYLTNSNPKQGETVGILFRVADSEMNQNFLELTEVSSKVRIPISREGHGYYSCEITFPSNLILGLYKIEFELTDLLGKKNKQYLEFNVVSM
ncbi:MAG: hypothetical protein HC853_01895 [Anaerolineae bacterium]|nr:hypothetical protein [Anaerolineae bacterium]